jgi:hypothetical protein
MARKINVKRVREHLIFVSGIVVLLATVHETAYWGAIAVAEVAHTVLYLSEYEI